MSPALLNEMLLHNVVGLTFVKKDGSTRVMNCTKSYELLSSFEGRAFLKYQEPKGEPQKMPDNQLTVWDVDVAGFRRINCDTVNIDSVIPDENFRKMLVEKFVG